jgi:hypothetical protein
MATRPHAKHDQKIAQNQRRILAIDAAKRQSVSRKGPPAPPAPEPTVNITKRDAADSEPDEDVQSAEK